METDAAYCEWSQQILLLQCQAGFATSGTNNHNSKLNTGWASESALIIALLLLCFRWIVRLFKSSYIYVYRVNLLHPTVIKLFQQLGKRCIGDVSGTSQYVPIADIMRSTSGKQSAFAKFNQKACQSPGKLIWPTITPGNKSDAFL